MVSVAKRVVENYVNSQSKVVENYVNSQFNLKFTYSDNPYYLIHSIELINPKNISKVLSKVLPMSRS